VVSKYTILNDALWPAGSKEIILTLDDGPNPDVAISNQLLDVLGREGVAGTFCHVGKNIERFPDVVRRAYREGHCLAFHTYSHTPLPVLSSTVLRKELERTEAIMRSIAAPGYAAPTHFRPPWGIVTSAVKWVTREQGLDIAYLTFLESEAWSGPSRFATKLRRIKERLVAHRGGAIVFHENCFSFTVDKSWLPGAVEDLIRWAKERGFTFTTYGEGDVMYGRRNKDIDIA